MHWTAFADDTNAIRTARSGRPGRVMGRRTRARLMRLHYVADGVAPHRHGRADAGGTERFTRSVGPGTCFEQRKTRGSGAEQRHDARQRRSSTAAAEEVWHCMREAIPVAPNRRGRKPGEPASSKSFVLCRPPIQGRLETTVRGSLKRLFGRQAFLPSLNRPSCGGHHPF